MNANGITKASRLNVPAGTLSRPIPRFLYRLGAPLRWFRGTTAHIAVLELYRLPQRILATRKKRFDRWGISLPSGPIQNPSSIAFELACTGGMETL